ncbi:uncharacterized protein LOC100909319 [Galendromus occidentalis]|uniref:Uncharacterized protein LOC100909319 n=1 Tax=Galendromus occidentalis TaxID=34638 RepID=A0AAJ6QXJ8_9ACAR|nr:uncharacterized protein LOC100909319 [Galendromus occidentalis]
MIRAAVCILALLETTSADPNEFFDRVLLDLGRQIRRDGLDSLDVDGFELKVEKTGFFTREFEASFSSGELIGLSTAVRDGDCADDLVDAIDTWFYTIKCKIVMPHARFAFDAVVKGDDIIGRSHLIATTTHLTNVSAEVMIARTEDSSKFKRLTVTSTGPLETNIVQGSVDLNPERKLSFISQINEKLSEKIGQLFDREYAQMLRMVIPRYVL